MNIDYKELALASNRRIEQLVKLEARLNELPQHLRALVPLLDTLVELGDDVQQLDTEAKKMIPYDIKYSLPYLHSYTTNLRNALTDHGNRLIAAIEPADE